MNSEEWNIVKAAFRQALSLSGEARETYLDEFSAENPNLGSHVRSLVAAGEQDDAALEAPVAAAVSAWASDGQDAWVGRTFGVWTITTRVAVGGMGAVFRARRTDDQFEQWAAVKMLSAHMLSADAVSRFRAERQILANLSHPFVAQLLDGGTTEEGLPYLVMEFVDGMPVDRYCDEHQLTIKERLRLFEKICTAVDYAHRNLVVHRDIKPSNILITDDGSPKLLDFGIAKLLAESPEVVPTSVTRVGVRALTLDYASPEQVRAEPITTATDVYSLGVLLYRLLTGHSPYRSTSGKVAELELEILDSIPTKPSSRISEPTTARTPLTAEEASKLRSTTIANLRKRLRGDLDNIVLMALRKEPERRYGSPREMVADIQRYLRHEPVVARNDSWHYRATKFVRRNVAAIAVTATLALLLATFSTVTWMQNKRIAQERDTATRVSDFLVEIFDLARPEERPGETVTAKEVLDSGRQRIQDELEEEPRIKGRLLWVMGEAYSALGLRDIASELLAETAELGAQGYLADGELAEVLAFLGETHSYLGEFDAATVRFDEATGVYARIKNPGKLLQIKVLQHQSNHLRRQGKNEESLTLMLEVEEVAHTLVNDPDGVYPDVLYNLGVTYWELHRMADAEAYFRKTLALDHPVWRGDTRQRAFGLSLLGDVLRLQGKPDEGLNYIEQSQNILTKIFGPDHIWVGTGHGNISNFYRALGRYEDAGEALTKALEVVQGALGPDHYRLGVLYGQFGALRANQERYEEALKLYKTSLDIKLKQLPERHISVALVYQRTGVVYRKIRNYDQSIADLSHALEIYLELLGEENIRSADVLKQLGRTYIGQGDLAKAETSLARSINAYEAVNVPIQIGDGLHFMGEMLIADERCDEAVPVLERALQEYSKSDAEKAEYETRTRALLATCDS